MAQSINKLINLTLDVFFIDEHESSEYPRNKNCKLYASAVRTIDGTLKTRTHNFELRNKVLIWENNNSKDWIYEFESNEQAEIWWKKYISTKIVKRK